MKHKRVFRIGIMCFAVIIVILLSCTLLKTVAHGAGLVDATVDSANEYSQYPLGNYQLDFYVDSSWDWLPWNWLDGIGKQVMYGLYAITNFIWTISLYLSNATGYVVQEAYRLDFISDTAREIGANLQTLAGVSQHGFSNEGFYVGFLLLFLFVMGIYVAYIGLIKRETTKAIHAVVNFIVVFLLSASFIAYAPDYIEKVNDFSADVSNASLSLGTKIVLPNSNSQGKDSVDLIRNCLFSIQVQQPWLLLQYGNSDITAVGERRVHTLLSTSPDANNGEDREEVVKEEIEDRNNRNLSITKTMNRLGMVFFLFLFNIGITIFVFLLTGIMIFSQVLFILYAMFLPISFLLSMLPTCNGMAKKAILKLFNVIMTRAGITLVITTAFSISTMLYTLSSGYPFFLIAFLQIVTFAGIYMKLGDLMSMFSLQSSDAQNVGKQIMRRPRMFMNRQARIMQRKLGHTLAKAGMGKAAMKKGKESRPFYRKAKQEKEIKQETMAEKQPSYGKKTGQAVGKVLDSKNRMSLTKEQARNLPANVKYVAHQGEKRVNGTVNDYQNAMTKERGNSRVGRVQRQAQRSAVLQQRQMALKKKQKRKDAGTESRQEIRFQDQRPATTRPIFVSSLKQKQPVLCNQSLEERKRPVDAQDRTTHQKMTPQPLRTSVRMKNGETEKQEEISNKHRALRPKQPPMPTRSRFSQRERPIGKGTSFQVQPKTHVSSNVSRNAGHTQREAIRNDRRVKTESEMYLSAKELIKQQETIPTKRGMRNQNVERRHSVVNKNKQKVMKKGKGRRK